MKSKDQQLLEEAYTQILIESNGKARLETIISQGVDIFYTLGDDNVAFVIYNAGSRSGNPEDSVLTAEAYDELFKNNVIVGEVASLMDESLFYDPSEWKPLTREALQQLSNKTLKVTDHNGSVFFTL